MTSSRGHEIKGVERPTKRLAMLTAVLLFACSDDGDPTEPGDTGVAFSDWDKSLSKLKSMNLERSRLQRRMLCFVDRRAGSGSPISGGAGRCRDCTCGNGYAEGDGPPYQLRGADLWRLRRKSFEMAMGPLQIPLRSTATELAKALSAAECGTAAAERMADSRPEEHPL